MGTLPVDDCGIMIAPEPAAWGELLAGAYRRIDTGAIDFRVEMGFGVAQPIVMAGHQAVVWHPGILAKMLALNAIARTTGALEAWVVVDHDEPNPWVVRFPVRLPSGELAARDWNMAPGGPLELPHVPAVNRPAIKPSDVPELDAGSRFGAPGVGEGLQRIAEALAKGSTSWNAADQVLAATRTLAASVVSPPNFFLASPISRTRLFREIIADMRSHPERVIETYNAAVAAHPHARVAPLSTGELPLWHIPSIPHAPRTRVTVDMLAAVPVTELAPRALLMTGILRWAGCDLFVHGTGGAGSAGEGGSGGYDAITTEWFRAWLGVELAPTAVVTATLRLRFDGAAAPTPRDIERARWLAHAARHRPALLQDVEGERERSAAVATLRTLRWKRDPAARRAKLEAYRALHRTLESVRERHARDLERLDAAEADAAGQRREAEIVADRTWPFPRYEQDQLRMLKTSIDGRFGR